MKMIAMYTRKDGLIGHASFGENAAGEPVMIGFVPDRERKPKKKCPGSKRLGDIITREMDVDINPGHYHIACKECGRRWGRAPAPEYGRGILESDTVIPIHFKRRRRNEAM